MKEKYLVVYSTYLNSFNSEDEAISFAKKLVADGWKKVEIYRHVLSAQRPVEVELVKV